MKSNNLNNKLLIAGSGSGGMREAIESAARPGGGGARRVRHLDAGAEVAKGAKILAIDLCNHCKSSLAESFNPPIIPPGGLRIPPV